MLKVLVLFPNDWDRTEFTKEKYQNRYQFEYAGPELFKFPEVLQLPFFSTRRFIEKMVRKVKQEGFAAVLSSDEYIGAAIAAIVAKKTGLVGSDASKIILAQHKYHSRLMQQLYCPEGSVSCELIPQKIPQNFKAKLPYPFFVKPVKGTFSLFAKMVKTKADLHKHMAFNWYERLVLKTITRPFNQLIKDHSILEHNANYFVGEELMDGLQVTLDGYLYEKEVMICGIVDSVMFPGTNIFERFEYPSRLPETIQQRMQSIVKKLMQGFGFESAQFNVELFYNAQTDDIKIIEINPRLSYQFGDLYENVDGTNTYQVLLDLALGHKPGFTKDQGDFQHTASFVLRTFEGKELSSVPRDEDIESFNERYCESNIKVYGKKGTRLSSEMRAIGSYRYGIVNVGAHSLLDLFSIYEDVLDSLPFSFK